LAFVVAAILLVAVVMYLKGRKSSNSASNGATNGAGSGALTSRVAGAFDCRQRWPAWAQQHFCVRSQGDCDSCYAFVVAQSLGDRLFIAHGINVQLSPQAIM